MLLKGIRVLDFTTLLPGPMCSLFLADLGAEIIKVEPIEGDRARFLDAEQNFSPFFEALNRNKKSICVNLKTKDGKKIALDLARKSDVVIESMRPRKMDGLGLGYLQIRKLNKKIIYCSLSAYGQTGARRKKAGHDLNFLSLSGAFELLKSKDVPGIQLADTSSSLVAAISILAALNNKNSTGKGDYIDVAILDSMLSMMNVHISLFSAFKKRSGLLFGEFPCYNVYKTKDGRFVSLAAFEEKFWENFCKSFDAKNLLKKRMDKSSVKNVAGIISAKTLGEIMDLSSLNEFCAEPVLGLQETLGDKSLESRKILLKNKFVTVGFPSKFNSSRLVYREAPKLGENTDEILSKIGFSKQEIKKMKEEKIVK